MVGFSIIWLVASTLMNFTMTFANCFSRTSWKNSFGANTWSQIGSSLNWENATPSSQIAYFLWFLKNRPIKIKALIQKPTSAWSSSWTCCCFGPRPSVCRTRSSLWDSFPGAVWLVFAEFLFFFFLRFPCSLFVGFIKFQQFSDSDYDLNPCLSLFRSNSAAFEGYKSSVSAIFALYKWIKSFLPSSAILSKKNFAVWSARFFNIENSSGHNTWRHAWKWEQITFMVFELSDYELSEVKFIRLGRSNDPWSKTGLGMKSNVLWLKDFEEILEIIFWTNLDTNRREIILMCNQAILIGRQ